MPWYVTSHILLLLEGVRCDVHHLHVQILIGLRMILEISNMGEKLPNDII